MIIVIITLEYHRVGCSGSRVRSDGHARFKSGRVGPIPDIDFPVSGRVPSPDIQHISIGFCSLAERSIKRRLGPIIGRRPSALLVSRIDWDVGDF